jgi:hypothetical protein
MGIYYESLEQFMQKGGLKQTTITAKQLLPAIVAHMVRMDRKFTLHVNGRLPKPMNELLDEVFELCHLQQPFYTQHCASRKSRYVSVSKNRVKIEFTFTYRMSREDEKWVVHQIENILQTIIHHEMTDVEKVIVVHDYIVRNYQYEMNTTGSPFTVLTFMKEGQGVCMAYALLFEKMMTMLNIRCLYVVGQAVGESDLGHAWNMVELDGQWYHIDATWNDLGSRSNKLEIRYRYLLKTDDFMKQDHTWQFAHYPACTSKHFNALQNIYDAAYYGGHLYFPNKEGYLSKLNLTTFVKEQVLPIKVQHCVVSDERLLFSNYSDHGYLYEYIISTKELRKLGDKFIRKIKSTTESIIVYYEDTDEIIKIHNNKQSKDTASMLTLKANIELPFIHFGDSWIGSYEGEITSVKFVSEDGTIFTTLQEMSQVTVTLSIANHVLDLSITNRRKSVQLDHPTTLAIPKRNVKEVTKFTNEHGDLIAYQEEHDCYLLSISKAGKIFVH